MTIKNSFQNYKLFHHIKMKIASFKKKLSLSKIVFRSFFQTEKMRKKNFKSSKTVFILWF